MSLNISGQILLPMGAPASNSEIKFHAVDSYNQVIAGGEQVARCDADGNYTLSIQYGRYELSTKISSVDFLTHGIVTILDSTVATDLEDLIKLIGMEGELNADIIEEFNHLVEKALDAANRAEAAAEKAEDTASGIGTAVEDAQAAAEAAAKSESNAGESAASAAEDAQYIKDHLTDADEAAAAAKASEEAAAASEVSSADNAKLAHDFAVGPNPPSALETPTDKNNAYYYFQQVLGLTGGVIAFGNKFTPTAANEYPEKPATSGMWVIETDADGYTFTGGSMQGVTCKTGDWFVYYKTLDAFEVLLVSPLHQDDIGQATETLAGIAEIATLDEVIAGLDDERFVTSQKLKKLTDQNSWKLHARGESELQAMREANKNQFAASGFVHFGKHVSSLESVNEGLWVRQLSSDVNRCYLGRGGGAGASELDMPQVHIAGFLTEIVNLQRSDGLYNEIKFDAAPDGRDTFNTATGVRLRHADVATAFAAAAADPDVEVVIDRHDIFGGEFFLEAVTAANPFVYSKGIPQTQATTMNGIATTRSNRPSTYYAVFDGDTTSAGLGVDFWAATAEEKIAMLSDESNNLFIIKDQYGVDMLVQWRMRQRTCSGAGNGDWFSINPASALDNSLCYQNKLSALIMPQGARDTVPNPDYTRNYRNIARTALTRPEVGVWSTHEQTPDDTYGVGNECYFQVWGVVRRLNQGAFHPSHNPLGTSAFYSETNANSFDAWHTSAGNRSDVNTTEDCFIGTDVYPNPNPAVNKAFFGRGDIAGGSYRYDGRVYDAIYAGGDGGVNDERVTAWDMGSKEEAAKIFQKVVNGTYRGEEKLIHTGFYGANDADGTGSVAIWFDFTDFPEGRTCHDVPIGSAVGGIRADGTGYFVGYVVGVNGNTSLTLDRNATRTSNVYIISFEMGSSVSGEFQMVDVMGDPAEILATPDLANGWQGGWIAGFHTNYNTVIATRKNVSGAISRNYTDNKGSSWGSDNPAWDSVNNTFTANSVQPTGRVELWVYTAFAKQTKEANNDRVLNANEGLGDVWVTQWNGQSVFAESMLGKVLTGVGSVSLYDNLPLTHNPIIPHEGYLVPTSNDDYTPTHSPLRLGAPANDSPAVKALWYQTSDNQQCGLNFAWNELVWGNDTIRSIDGTTSQTINGYEKVLVNGGNLGGKVILRERSSALTINLNNAMEADGKVYTDPTSFTSGGYSFVTVSGANFWGDDSTVRITDGTGTYTNLNGDVCLYGSAELTKRYGYTKNRARAGE